MKILKRGKSKVKAIKEVCYECGSELEYSEKDVKQDRDGRYIVCPVCGKFIAVR